MLILLMLLLNFVTSLLHRIILQCVKSMVVLNFRVFSSYVSCGVLELALAVKPELSVENYPVIYGISLELNEIRNLVLVLGAV